MLLFVFPPLQEFYLKMSEIEGSLETPEKSNNSTEPQGEDIQEENPISDSQKVSLNPPQSDEEEIVTTEVKPFSENVEENNTKLENQTNEMKTHETTPQIAINTKEAQESNSSCKEATDKTECDKDRVEDTQAKSSVNESSRDEKNVTPDDQYAKHVTYTADGTAIYTDPKTNYKYKWCNKANNWIPNDDTRDTSANPYENEHYKWCTETQKWIPKQTQVTETEHYKWDSEKNEWVAKVKPNMIEGDGNQREIVYEIDDEGQRTYTDKDGTVFFWDEDKSAWFPKIDDDFMARYQMSYGFIDNTSASEKEKEELERVQAVEKEKELAKMVAEAKANEEASKDLNKQGIKRKGQQEPPSRFYFFCVALKTKLMLI